MFKLAHHPKAFLTLKRNVQPGLSARTQIISVLEKRACNTKKISRETGLSYASVLHHLHLLEAENILSRRGRRTYVWELTGAGQQRLITGKES
ncbi:MAG: winged helix-turn-helix transcriptional regulator [Candidatus Bathyarchaeum sp.]|nr:MAG: winged helix-turn-helix transcriptional regulator [Candidatus Bathyarchaeum sp.]